MGVITDQVPKGKTAAPKRRLRRPVFLMGAVVVILLLGLIIFIQHRIKADSSVPVEIQKAASFPIYYPEQAKLPSGYSLDNTSFRFAQPGVVVYALQKGSQQLVFSEEETPDGDVVNKFTSSYIPLHNTITTGLGKAAIGAAGQGSNLQTIVSLPITDGPWLIITAPAGSKQSDMQQILQSLVK
jgi:hypothetical protein